MALGGALGLAWAPVTPRHFAWQAWHNLTSTFVSRGRRGTNSHLPSFHVAGVALMALGGALGLAWAPVTPRHFAWQAWHNLTSTFVSRGRRGTNSHLPSFHVAGVALMALGGALGLAWAPVTPRHFAWQAWHKLTPTFVSRGRRGTNSHLPSFHVAGVALMALGGALGLAWAPVTPRHFAWQAWHNLTSTFVSRGRRGTNSHLPSFHVAGVALMALGGALGLAWAPVTPRHFAWQAWHKLTPTFVSHGRRGTHGTGWRAWTGLGACDAAALCVAGVAQTHTHLRFTWQAWHKLTSTFVSRGRRGTHGTGWRAWTGLGACDAAALCVAGVAQTHIYCRFAWQAWHKLTSTLVSRGRRGTDGTGWRAWTGLGACDAAALCVAGVAQTHIYCRFAWQAWHKLTSTVVLRGRRGTHGTGWRAWTGLGACDAAALCVAGVAQTHIYCRFAWQAWHKLTSTVVLRGRRGTDGTGWRAWTGLGARDAAALCVAGVAQTHIYCRFAWQAWHKLTSTVVLRGMRGTDGTGQVKLVICMQRCGPCSWSRGRAQLRFSNAVQRRHDRFCFLHADFHHVVLVVLFWSLWPN